MCGGASKIIVDRRASRYIGHSGSPGWFGFPVAVKAMNERIIASDAARAAGPVPVNEPGASRVPKDKAMSIV